MRLLAALVFFTRLPFWRIADIPKEYFKRLVEYWSLTGVLTGGIMALVLFLTSLIMPIEIATIFAISSRLDTFFLFINIIVIFFKSFMLPQPIIRF